MSDLNDLQCALLVRTLAPTPCLARLAWYQQLFRPAPRATAMGARPLLLLLLVLALICSPASGQDDGSGPLCDEAAWPE